MRNFTQDEINTIKSIHEYLFDSGLNPAQEESLLIATQGYLAGLYIKISLDENWIL